MNSSPVCTCERPSRLNTSTTNDAPRRRVILGLNCFPAEVDECCRRAPEHSDAFNRTVKLYQKMASVSQQQNCVASIDGDKPAGRLSAKDVAKNPALARLLVLAARNMKKKKKKEEEEEVASRERVNS